MQTAADNVVAALELSDVRRANDFLDGSLNGFTDALRDDGELECTHVRREEAGRWQSKRRSTGVRRCRRIACVNGKPRVRPCYRRRRGGRLLGPALDQLQCRADRYRVFVGSDLRQYRER
jgi:hypothetical protein